MLDKKTVREHHLQMLDTSRWLQLRLGLWERRSHLIFIRAKKQLSTYVPVSFSSLPFLREGITLLQSRQDGVVWMATVQKLTTNDNRLSINQVYNPLIEMNAFFTKFINAHLLSHEFSGFRLIVDKMRSSISLNCLNYSLTRSRIWTVIY